MKNFTQYSETIQEGDLVLLFVNPRQIYPVYVKKDDIFHHTTGAYHHNRIIDQPYGTRMQSHTKQGSMYLLHPSCERWTMNLPHRTQIVYSADISVICGMLDLVAGSRVVESGTGSASLTHSLARIVAPMGHVYTFEYHKLRAETAKKEFGEHGLSDYVTINEANVYESGFKVSDGCSIDGTIDAVFLDLPEPWKAIKHTVRLFQSGKEGRICCFSPCVEQVQKTREALVEFGFTDITMMECLQKNWEVRKVQNPSIGGKIEKKRVLRDDSQDGLMVPVCHEAMKGHTAYLTFASFLPREFVPLTAANPDASCAAVLV